MDKILFQMHVMWYESQMMTETLDSLQDALQHSSTPVELQFCLNAQTYIEEPIEGSPDDMFNAFLEHPIMKQSELIYKTNDDPFYNIGDWRREVYDESAKYTVWGESDCLLPEDFFYILSNVQIKEPHTLTFASRKMWDNTWDCVEHEYVEQFERLNGNPYTAPIPYNSDDIIAQWQLNAFNEKYDDVVIKKLSTCKIDGSLLCLSKGLPVPFIAPNMHFVREDTCAERVFARYHIPQFVVKNRMKGHNYGHPLKRMNTRATRRDTIYQQYARESADAMNIFLGQIYAM